MEILILIFLIILNGVFAMSEIALVTAKRSRLLSRISKGDKKAKAALKLSENPTQFLSAVQIGITSIGLLSGIFGESALAVPLTEKFQSVFNLSQASAHLIASGIIITAITYFSIVIGELVPKRLGQLNPEGIACVVAFPMALLSLISRPFIILLTFSTNFLINILKIKENSSQAVTEEELKAMISESSDNGIIDIQEKELIHNIFRLDDNSITSIMIPKQEIIFLDKNTDRQKNIQFLKQTKYTYLPICNKEIDNIIGYISTKEALLLLMKEDTTTSDILEHHALRPLFLPEKITILQLLKTFQTNELTISFIIDEYGVLQGMLPMKNIFNILVGQINNNANTLWAEKQNSNSWILNGSIPIIELKEKLGIDILPAEEKNYYTILSGMLMYLAGKIPVTGEIYTWQNWKFKILTTDGTKIERVEATKNAQHDII